MTAVAGVDLSLTGTGIVTADGTPYLVETKDKRGEERLDYIAAKVREHTTGADVVLIEGFSFGSKGSAVYEIGGVGWLVRWMLWRTGQRYVIVPPATLKMYATGRGNANKADMLAAAIKRLGVEFTDDNLVDATWLRAAGLDLACEPLVTMPEVNRRALGVLRRG